MALQLDQYPIFNIICGAESCSIQRNDCVRMKEGFDMKKRKFDESGMELVTDENGHEVSPIDDDYEYYKSQILSPLDDDYCKYDNE